MARLMLLASGVAHLVAADCPACCVPKGSPASTATGAVVCDECNLVAMQTNCLMDKADALCTIVPKLRSCAKAGTASQKQQCALASKQIIMGQGPDAGDLGILSDYYVCCQRGATAFKPYRNDTCYETMQQAGGTKDKVQAFHDKYWSCVSPGTRTTPKGVWTAECDKLADDAEELVAFTLQTHDASLEPCYENLNKIKAADTGKCGGIGMFAGIKPDKMMQMSNDWTDTAWADNVLQAKAATKRCVAAKWEPGCSKPNLVAV